jgi:holo-[acyl-carrier protein] synthase
VGRHVGWLDVEVVRAEDGRPTLRLHGKAAATAAALGATRLHVALTHTRDTAAAHVVLEDVPSR